MRRGLQCNPPRVLPNWAVPCISTWNRLRDHRTSIAKLRILSAQQNRLPHFNATVATLQLQGNFLERRNCTSASTNKTKQFLFMCRTSSPIHNQHKVLVSHSAWSCTLVNYLELSQNSGESPYSQWTKVSDSWFMFWASSHPSLYSAPHFLAAFDCFGEGFDWTTITMQK